MRYTRRIQSFFLMAVLLAMVACGTSPERKLQQGYASASAAVKSTTVLLNRKEISSEDAQRVLMIGRTAKESLDTGKDKLIKCWLDNPGSKCEEAVSNIDMGAGLLIELEKFLEARQPKSAP